MLTALTRGRGGARGFFFAVIFLTSSKGEIGTAFDKSCRGFTLRRMKGGLRVGGKCVEQPAGAAGTNPPVVAIKVCEDAENWWSSGV